MFKFVITVIVFFAIMSGTLAEKVDKKAKLRKPESDAEKALDYVLRVDNGLVKGVYPNYEEMFTKDFNKDYKRQVAISEKSESCKKWMEDCLPWDVNIINCAQDPTYKWSLENPYAESFKWTDCKNNMDECEIKMNVGTYYMKKEDGKWKIDAICCGRKCFYSVNIAGNLTNLAT